MSDDKIVNMAERTGNSRHITAEQLLENVLKELRDGEILNADGTKPTKALLFLLDAKGSVFEYDVFASNLTHMELLNLVTLAQHETAATYHNG